MRFFTSAVLALAALTVFGPQPSYAQPPAAAGEAAVAQAVPPGQTDQLDGLYQRLKRTSDAASAAAIARQIDAYLDRSPSATVSLLIEWSDDAENNGRSAAALDFLSEAIALRPDEAAPYRKRAVLHFTHGELARAMDDIRTALSFEPRDFSALGLMAAILDRTGRPEAAIEVWRRYLEFYPADRDVTAFIESTLNARAGKRI